MTVSVQRLREPLRINKALPALVGIYVLALIALQATDRITEQRAGTLLVAPLVVWLATQYPNLLVIGFVAIPPGWLTSIPGTGVIALTVLFTIALSAHIVLRGRFDEGMLVAAAPIGILIAGAYFSLDVADPTAAAAAIQFRRTLVLYIVLFALAYVLAASGTLRLTSLGTALLCSAGISGLIFIWQTDGQPWTYISTGLSAELEPGGLFYRTHFGYMMALGFAVALARVVSRAPRKHLVVDLALLVFFSLMVTFSFTRGAWLIAFVLVTMIPFHTGKKIYWLLLPLIAVIALGIPVIEQRLLSDITGGLQRSLESGDLGTGRWGLWQELWNRGSPALPEGQGFGYIWSLSPNALFAHSSFTTEGNPFVYAHNDFLYWTVELGLLGLGAMLVFWTRIAAVVRRSTATARAVDPRAAFVGGVVLTMFVASMADNGMFISAVAQRFFIVAGATWAIASASRRSPHTGTSTR